MRREDLKANIEFDSTLLRQMCWSKNTNKERDAPDQILMGAMDLRYCILLALAIHLETWFNSPTGSTPANIFLFGIGGEDEEKGQDRTKKTIYNILQKMVFKHSDFVRAQAGPVGSHSFRKFPATQARKRGVSRDDVDGRGRWQNKLRTSDKYMDVSLPCNDAKVAAKLCMGGAIKYEIREGQGVSKLWLRENVTPLIANFMGDAIAETLGAPLLWAAMDDELALLLPEALRQHIQAAFLVVAPTDNVELITNPIKRVPLVVSGEEGEMHIVAMQTDDDGQPVGGGAIGAGGGGHETLNAILHLVANMQQDVVESGVELELFRKETRMSIKRVLRSLQRFALQPGNRVNVGAAATILGDDNEGIVIRPATLSKNLKDLHVLWREYKNGLGGRKAAKLFMSAQRGRVKALYHRQKVVWDAVATLIRAGNSADVAIDQIYQAYGEGLLITRICAAMLADRRTGGHPNLHVGIFV